MKGYKEHTKGGGKRHWNSAARAKNRPGQPEARRDKEGSSPTGFRGNRALPTPRPSTSSLQNLETRNRFCRSHPVCGTLFRQPKQTKTTVGSHHKLRLINIPDRETFNLWEDHVVGQGLSEHKRSGNAARGACTGTLPDTPKYPRPT